MKKLAAMDEVAGSAWRVAVLGFIAIDYLKPHGNGWHGVKAACAVIWGAGLLWGLPRKVGTGVKQRRAARS